MAKLKGKHESFVNEYLQDFNATEAYKRAGYKATGAAARACASKLLTNANVSAEIAARQAKVQEGTIATAQRLETELERIALFDLRRLFAKDGRMLALAELGEDVAAVVASFEVVEGESSTTKKVKLCDKLGAIGTLLKRRDTAAHGEPGSKDNPHHQRISFIEFADVDDSEEEIEGVPYEGPQNGRLEGPALES